MQNAHKFAIQKINNATPADRAECARRMGYALTEATHKHTGDNRRYYELRHIGSGATIAKTHTSNRWIENGEKCPPSF